MKSFFTASGLKRSVVIFAILLMAENVFTSASGPATGYTDAPGESDCTGCHAGSPITSGSDWSNIVLAKTGGSLSSIAPNSSNAMTLSFSSSSSTKFGFEMVVVPTSATGSSNSVGTFSVGTSSIVQTSTTSSPTRVYLMHTSTGTAASSGTKTWSFNWVTPVGFSGGATFYVALNEADGDNSNSGDNIYLKSFSTTVLPVRWLDFKATQEDESVVLKFSTAQEINNDRFDIERSEDGKEFRVIGSVKGKGNSEVNSYYTFNDNEKAEAKVFYRVKQVDYDGKSDYSKTISFDPNAAIEPKVLNDGNGHSILFGETQVNHTVKVWGLNGQLIQQYNDINTESLKLSGLQNGMYLIEVNSIAGSQWLKKVLIQ